MTLKKFGIFSSIIISLIIITTIVLACVKVDNGLNIDEPEKIIVYAKTATGVTYTKEGTPKNYNELKKLYKEMTNISIFNYMINGESIQKQPSQDLNSKYEWSSSNKSSYYCVEFKFNKKQTVVVKVDEGTKVIEFYSLIMTVEESNLGKETAIYFTTSEGSSSYQKSPLLVTAKQDKIYDFIKKTENKD